MTETLTGKQVLALLAQDEVPEIECGHPMDDDWCVAPLHTLTVDFLRTTKRRFRIKPKTQRRLSVTLANGEVVSWPEPVREALKDGQEYWVPSGGGTRRFNYGGDNIDVAHLISGQIHLTQEAAREHYGALRKINTQEQS